MTPPVVGGIRATLTGMGPRVGRAVRRCVLGGVDAFSLALGANERWGGACAWDGRCSALATATRQVVSKKLSSEIDRRANKDRATLRRRGGHRRTAGPRRRVAGPRAVALPPTRLFLAKVPRGFDIFVDRRARHA
jgi:hypothetical protein